MGGKRVNWTDELVHHRDHNKENNDIKNLQIVSRAEHIIIHTPRLNTGTY